jgi:hypothetical protein
MMISKTVEYYLTQKTSDLRMELGAACTMSGEGAWLFVPKETERKVCLVAHIDTVHDEPAGPKRLIREHGIVTSPHGLGADDRAGVWAGLHLYNEVAPDLQPYLLLCDLEERHGIGAREASMRFNDIIRSEAITYFIEIDRRGCGEAVFYAKESAKFRNYVTSFGFRESQGSFSDISILGPAAGKCAVNMSAGYYNAHTLNEFLNIAELMETVDKIKLMLLDNKRQSMIWPLVPHQTNYIAVGKYSEADAGLAVISIK